MPVAHVNGIDLNYERRGPTTGEGPRVLFLNGSSATLANTQLLLDPFAERFDLLAHDQRGLGGTEVPPGPYTMADYAADAAGLLDHVGWESCRVVGVSFGGMVAQELAVTWPERVERLALACTSPGGDAGHSFPLHELAGLDVAARGERMTILVDTRFTPDWLATHPGDQRLVDFMRQREVAAGPKSPEVERGEREQLGARAGHDVVDRLSIVSCPTLVAGGRYDGIAPPANSEAIASRIPGADLRFYDGGHMFFIQDATALPAILDFLAS